MIGELAWLQSLKIRISPTLTKIGGLKEKASLLLAFLLSNASLHEATFCLGRNQCQLEQFS